jgi:hypothetical protein
MNIGHHEGVRKYGRILFGILFSAICGFMLSIPLLRMNFIEDISAYYQIQNREVLESTLRDIEQHHHITLRNAYKDLYSELPYDVSVNQINEYVPPQNDATNSQLQSPNSLTLATVEGLTNCSSNYLGKALQEKFSFNKSEIMTCMNELQSSIHQLEKDTFAQSSIDSAFISALKTIQIEKQNLQVDQLLALYHQLHPPGLVQSGLVVFQAVPIISWSFVLFVIFMMLSPILLKIFGPKSIYDYFVDEYNRIPLAEKGIQLHRYDVLDKEGKDAGLIDRYFEYEELVEQQKESYLEKLKNLQSQRYEEFKDKYMRVKESIASKE